MVQKQRLHKKVTTSTSNRITYEITPKDDIQGTNKMIKLAAIGLGGRATSVLRILYNVDNNVRLVAVADPDTDGVRKRLSQRFPDEKAEAVKNLTFYDSADKLLDNANQYDGIIIGTRCNLHTPMAVKVAKTDLPLYLEKPVAIDDEQLAQLADAYKDRKAPVVVSFPLRVSPLVKETIRIIRSGQLGTINQVHAFNYVSYGGTYFGSWYRDYETTGGLWMQKATHDFDYVNAILDKRPLTIAAMSTRNLYGGDMPENLRCSQCDQAETCIESPQAKTIRGDLGGMNWGENDHLCPFSKSIKHQDAGSAILRYDDGMHVTYTQNFISRRSAQARGVHITGYKATLKFDWSDDKLIIINHHKPTTETISFDSTDGHGGGDDVLAKNFIDVIVGKAESQTPIEDGLISAAICIAARKSASTQTFQHITIPNWPDNPAPYQTDPTIEP